MKTFLHMHLAIQYTTFNSTCHRLPQVGREINVDVGDLGNLLRL